MRRNSFFSVAINISFLALLAVVGYSTYKMVGQAYAIWGENDNTKKRIQELVIQKSKLEAALAELETNEGIEKEAKRRLNLKLPGEEVVVVLPEEDSYGTSTADSHISWWQSVKVLFERVNFIFDR